MPVRCNGKKESASLVQRLKTTWCCITHMLSIATYLSIYLIQTFRELSGILSTIKKCACMKWYTLGYKNTELLTLMHWICVNCDLLFTKETCASLQTLHFLLNELCAKHKQFKEYLLAWKKSQIILIEEQHSSAELIRHAKPTATIAFYCN